jgi:hypothetical protein
LPAPTAQTLLSSGTARKDSSQFSFNIDVMYNSLSTLLYIHSLTFICVAYGIKVPIDEGIFCDVGSLME